jgi:hypothetical protein
MDITSIDSIIEMMLQRTPLTKTKLRMYPTIVIMRLERLESLYTVFSNDPNERTYELKSIMFLVRETCWQIQNDANNTLEIGIAQNVVEELKNFAAITIGAQTPEEFNVGRDVLQKLKRICQVAINQYTSSQI